MRGHHQGSVFQRREPNRAPRWVAVVSVGRGKRISRYAKSRPDAFAKLKELQAVAAIGLRPPPVVVLPEMPTAAARSMRIPTALTQKFLGIAREAGWTPRSVPEARVAVKLGNLGLRPGLDIDEQMKVGRFRVDFACPDIQVAIEVDGPHHRLPENAVKDLERDASMSAAGWFVFRVDAYASDDEMDNRLGRIVRFIRCERLA